MDAGIVLTTPQTPPSSAAESSPDVSREDAEAFAAHLPQETQAKPAPRKPASDKEELTDDEEKKTASAAPPPSFSLTSPTAPVLVRDDGASAVLNIALTPAAPPTGQPVAAPAAPDAAAAITPAPGPALKTPLAADIATPAAAPTARVAATPQAGATDDGATPPAPQSAPTAENAAPSFNLPTAESLAAVATAPAKPTTTEPATESLRNAGRPRGARAEAQAIAETKAVSPAAASAQSGARPDARPEFNAASAAAPVATASSDTTAQPAGTGEAAAVSLEARRAAEAPPLAVHRPPSVAATVAQHVIRRFDGKSTTIDVRLDPAELGKVSVKLEVGPDSRVTAVVAADNPATLSDLMRSARELERALESAGLELTQGGLSFDLSDRSSGGSAQAGDPGSSAIRAGNDNAVVADTPAAPASRPFGLESWRGVRVDVTV